jgi:hypothetical protein
VSGCEGPRIAEPCSVRNPIYLSIHLSIYLSIYLSICLSIYLSQAERHRITADDVYFLLEIRDCKTGDVVLSKALCLGQATQDARGPGYCWMVPEMPTVIDAPWSFDGSGFYRRTDGCAHHLDFVLSRPPGDSFRFPGGDDDGDGDGDGDDDGDGDGSGSEEGEEEGEDSEEDGFIDDGHAGEEEEEGSDDGSNESEGECHGDGEDDEDEDDHDDQDDEAAKAPKRRRLVVQSDEDEDDESDEAGGEALLIPQYDGAGSEEEEDDDDVGGEEADDSEDDSLRNSGDYELSRKDFCDEMNLVVAHAPCDPNDDDDHEERVHRQCCLAFECSADNEHVPKVILQFQSGDFDLWEPERSWVGEHGHRTAGIWAILDSLRWG